MSTETRRRAIRELESRPFEIAPKGLPAAASSLSASDLAEAQWNVLDGDLPLPALTLDREALEHNLATMAAYCSRVGVDLAPHAKTSMAPQLLERHLAAGAWGFTVATTHQARILTGFGFNRLILASQVVEVGAVEWLSGEMDNDPNLEIVSLVDSLAGVRLIEDALTARNARRPLRVLVELGELGGRTGCRTTDEAVEVAKAVSSSQHLVLAGVEGFEGLIDAGSTAATLAAVDGFLSQLRELVISLDELGCFDGREEVVVSAGGSAYFDRVVEYLTGFELTRPVRTVLRSGCYAAHDEEMYEAVSPLAGRSGGAASRLQPALSVWAAVWSRPETGLVIAGAGKRDLAYDYRLPVVTGILRGGSHAVEAAAGFSVQALNDQHAYVSVPDDALVEPGDTLRLGISHPCAAFDKWRVVPVVDAEHVVVDAYHTFF